MPIAMPSQPVTASGERAQAVGVSPTIWVRTTLARALGEPAECASPAATLHRKAHGTARVKLTLRMTREHATAPAQAPRRAGMTSGDFVADMVAAVPGVRGSAGRADHIATPHHANRIIFRAVDVRHTTHSVDQMSAIEVRARTETASVGALVQGPRAHADTARSALLSEVSQTLQWFQQGRPCDRWRQRHRRPARVGL